MTYPSNGIRSPSDHVMPRRNLHSLNLAHLATSRLRPQQLHPDLDQPTPDLTLRLPGRWSLILAVAASAYKMVRASRALLAHDRVLPACISQPDRAWKRRKQSQTAEEWLAKWLRRARNDVTADGSGQTPMRLHGEGGRLPTDFIRLDTVRRLRTDRTGAPNRPAITRRP